MVPLTGVVVSFMQLKLDRERFENEARLDLLRLALDERMPDAMRARILAGLSSAAPDGPDAVPVVESVAGAEKQRVEKQLADLADEKKSAQDAVNSINEEKKEAEKAVVKAPDNAGAAKKLEQINEKYDEERLRLETAKYRLGEGGPPAVRERPFLHIERSDVKVPETP
jgi:hypothetical protein